MIHDSSRQGGQLEALREWLVGISHLQVRFRWEIHGEFMPDFRLLRIALKAARSH